MKLWDIRKLVNLEETKYQRNFRYTEIFYSELFNQFFDVTLIMNLFRTGFDYRYQRYPATQSRSHPSDSSITTYKGHAVLRTLIRCYFSPSYSTSQNYVYTGSADEHFYVYDIDGNLLVRCNAKATNYVEDGYANYENTVRDVSWHPYQPLMVRLYFPSFIFRYHLIGPHTQQDPLCFTN